MTQLYLITNNGPFAACFVAANSKLEAFALWRIEARAAAREAGFELRDSITPLVITVPELPPDNHVGVVNWSVTSAQRLRATHFLSDFDVGHAPGEEFRISFESLETMAIEEDFHRRQAASTTVGIDYGITGPKLTSE